MGVFGSNPPPPRPQARQLAEPEMYSVLYTREFELFIEDQAFSPSYDLAPSPPLPPLPSASCLSFSVFLCVAGRAYWREMGDGVGEEPNHTTARKSGPL